MWVEGWERERKRELEKKTEKYRTHLSVRLFVIRLNLRHATVALCMCIADIGLVFFDIHPFCNWSRGMTVESNPVSRKHTPSTNVFINGFVIYTVCFWSYHSDLCQYCLTCWSGKCCGILGSLLAIFTMINHHNVQLVY